jgi:hypothetical protein
MLFERYHLLPSQGDKCRVPRIGESRYRVRKKERAAKNKGANILGISQG